MYWAPFFYEMEVIKPHILHTAGREMNQSDSCLIGKKSLNAQWEYDSVPQVVSFNKMSQKGSNFSIPYHCIFSMGTLKNDPYTYSVNEGTGRVLLVF